MLRIYNTLTKKKQVFKPLDGKTVKMYTCGVTVYDDCHIGHARSLYIFDVIQRYLRYKGKQDGFSVKFVRNITDVDDKIINKAKALAAARSLTLTRAFDEVRSTYIERYRRDLASLGIEPADAEPLATENIPAMVEFIRGLMAKGFAYEAAGSVYFSVRKFTAYGRLSGKKIDDLFCSVRIDNDPLKRDPLDFALWKKAGEGEPGWESPWGRGRPGWHIECSVMSRRYLGADTLDIHGGGRDLVFPHHENERAQSEALTGRPFANYWIHHGLITINRQKMAKSSGDFVTVREAVSKYGADILKIFFLQAHYSRSIDFSEEKMAEAKRAYERVDILMGKLKGMFGIKDITKRISAGTGDMSSFQKKFLSCMDDDFNMPKALAVLFDMVNRCNKLLESGDNSFLLRGAIEIIKEITAVFGLDFLKEKKGEISVVEIKEKIKLREVYRKEKRFKEADQIRKELEEKGVILEDTGEGAVWRRKA